MVDKEKCFIGLAGDTPICKSKSHLLTSPSKGLTIGGKLRVLKRCDSRKQECRSNPESGLKVEWSAQSCLSKKREPFKFMVRSTL